MEREARNGVPPEDIPSSGMIAPAAASPPNAAVMGPKDGTMTAKNALNAVMGPKNGTMTAKNALNAVMGPKNGTMAALKSYCARLFPKGLSECQRGKRRKGRPPEGLCTPREQGVAPKEKHGRWRSHGCA